MNFKPLGERVLVQRVEEENRTASGIIIPDNAKEKPSQGIVKAVSETVAQEGAVVLDDRVVFGQYSGVELGINGTTYLILETKDILGVLK
jgi:chaperonin GroES